MPPESQAIPLLVIVGPTAGGKTDLAIEVALRLAHEPGMAGPGEAISADAFQIYRGMDIGTGKPTLDERRGVPHHLLDIRSPREPFTVDEWLREAERTIADVRSRGRAPIVVGGTHFYIKALLEGLFEGPAGDEALRAEMNAMPRHALREELERVDPAAAARIHPNDLRRTVRALEVFRLTGVPISRRQQQWDRGRVRPDALLVTLDWPADAINRRINARVRRMVESGLVEEVRGLLTTGALGPQAREALGYKQIASALEAGGHPNQIEEAVEQTKILTRRFAKAQRTWLRRLSTTPKAIRISATETAQDMWPQIVLTAWRHHRQEAKPPEGTP